MMAVLVAEAIPRRLETVHVVLVLVVQVFLELPGIGHLGRVLSQVVDRLELGLHVLLLHVHHCSSGERRSD